MQNNLFCLGNIPVSTATAASLFSELKAGNQKVRQLELGGQLVRLKKGLYVVAPSMSRVPLSTELIANHLYAPSYVSMSTALRYYGLIPEAVYLSQSMTLKHSRAFSTPVGRFPKSGHGSLITRRLPRMSLLQGLNLSLPKQILIG